MSIAAGTEKTSVKRARLETRDMDVMAALINRQYVEHKAWFRCPAPSRVDAGIRLAVAGPIEASIARYRGFEYYGEAFGPEDHLVLVVLNGEGTFTRSREQLHFARGDVILLPSGEHFKADLKDFAYSLVRIPRDFLTAYAAEQLGQAAQPVRIESIAPHPRHAGARWARAASLICGQLLDEEEADISPILAQEMARMAVATVLEVFPYATFTPAHMFTPSWAPPATVRRATAFIHAHADRPLPVTEIA